MFTSKSIAAEHKDLIQDVAYDFHGKRMATCSCDQHVKVSCRAHRRCPRRHRNRCLETPHRPQRPENVGKSVGCGKISLHNVVTKVKIYNMVATSKLDKTE